MSVFTFFEPTPQGSLPAATEQTGPTRYHHFLPDAHASNLIQIYNTETEKATAPKIIRNRSILNLLFQLIQSGSQTLEEQIATDRYVTPRFALFDRVAIGAAKLQ